MAPRKYEKRQRAETMDETRRRILAASLALHTEKGFQATTWKDIAERADVAVGTVYYHFPTIDHLVPACGAFAQSLVVPPDSSIFEGLTTIEERVEAFVRAFFKHFSVAGGGLANAVHERHKVPIVNALMSEIERLMRALLKEAVGKDVPTAVLKRAEALADYRVWESFRSRGIAQEVIVSTVTASILAIIRGTKG